jgi:hypothetical protein
LRKRIKPEKSQLAPLARLAHDCIHDTVHIDLTFTYRIKYRTVRHTDRRYTARKPKKSRLAPLARDVACAIFARRGRY